MAAASGSPSNPIDLSDLEGYGGYNSFNPDWSLVSQPVTPTPTETATPTYTPTYAPSTSLDFNGANIGLKAVMFWAIYRESNLDAVDSGNYVDNDLGYPRLSSFLFDYPYCSTGTGINDNGVETPNPSKNWYIRHCPGDYRYMAAQTMMNGFLNYERRYGLSHLFQYATANFGGTVNDTTNGMWNLDPNCITTIGSNYDTAYNLSSSSNSYAPVINWLTSYMNCIATSTSTNYRVVRAQRAYNNTILPEIVSAVGDFYTLPKDYTNAAFQAKVVNFSSQTAVACVGGCYINGNLGTVVYTFLFPQDSLTAFATSLGSITQTDVDNAYSAHITQISTYSGDFDSVAQPVLIEGYDLSTGNRVGYTWETEIYQQAQDMSHSPR